MLALRAGTQGLVLILLARLLGPATYGSFAAASSLAVVLGILPNLGAGFVMLAHGTHSKTGAGDVWRYAWPSTVALGLILLLIYVPASWLLLHSTLPIIVLLAIGSAELLSTPFAMISSFALQTREMVPMSQFVQWLPLGLRIAAIAPCFAAPPAERLITYAALQCITALLGASLGLWITTQRVALDWRPRMATLGELRSGISYAAMQLIAANPSELDKVIAIRAVGQYEAGIYTATARIMSAAVTPVTALLLSALPKLFQHANRPSADGPHLVGLIAKIALIWGCLSGVGLALISHILPILFGHSYVDTAKLMPWLAAVAPMLALRLCAGSILIAYGKPLERAAFELCGALILVGCILVLTPRNGVFGLAAALFIAETSMSIIGWALVWRRLSLHSQMVAPGSTD